MIACKKEVPQPSFVYQDKDGKVAASKNTTLNENTSGTVTFWNDDNQVGRIYVNAGDKSAVIYSNAVASGCYTSGAANFTFQPGRYSFSANATTGESWSGEITIIKGSCLTIRLN